MRGTLAYVVFGTRLLRAYIGYEDDAEALDRTGAVSDAAFACAFVLFWRWQISSPLSNKGYSLKKHFLTRETFLDVVTVTQTRILLVILYREFYPDFKIHGKNGTRAYVTRVRGI